MIYAVVFLFGGVLMLAWWLFKMEVASGHFISRREWAEERCKDLEQASRNRKQGLDELARALGYEWKRTEAKEGWEKKAILTNDDIAQALKTIPPYPSFGCIAIGTGLFKAGYVDRRKGDRRKAAGGKATLIHGDEPCGFCNRPFPKKKPRRAH